MESTEELKIAERNQDLKDWLLSDCGLSSVDLQPMPGDASFRRYFRVTVSTGSFVAMDAPPPQENCQPFVAVANALRALDLNTPDIIVADVKKGFLLLTDFGDATYLKTLQSINADSLYQRALDALVVLQSCQMVPGHKIPAFNQEFMWKEWAWHKEWFLDKLLGLSIVSVEANLDECYAHIVESATSQPQVFMHRDYHSANLMVLPNDVGILDFQDAFHGPVTYDLVSLLRDCYIDWPQESVNNWILYYWQQLNKLGVLSGIPQQQFMRWFDLMGMQRHLKALFTFARKHVRDHQSRYLNYVPRVLTYLLTVSKSYPEFSALHEYLSNIVQPTFLRFLACER